jgi:hypothetical protein
MVPNTNVQERESIKVVGVIWKKSRIPDVKLPLSSRSEILETVGGTQQIHSQLFLATFKTH